MGVVWGNDKSDRGVDFAPDYRGVSLGQFTSLSYSGPGHCVWSDLQAAVACYGHSGQADRSPIAAAEPVRREADRHDPTGMSRPQCATNIPMEKEVWSCAKDEGRPLASRDQELDANRCELLPLRAVVVSVAERVGPDPALVRLGETSESKPSMKGRKGIVDVETEVMWSSRDKLGRRPEARPKRHPARRRRDSETGFCTERGNLSS